MIIKALTGCLLFAACLSKIIYWITIANKTASIAEANTIYAEKMPQALRFLTENPGIDITFNFLLAGIAGLLLWTTRKTVFRVIAVAAFVVAFWMLWGLM